MIQSLSYIKMTDTNIDTNVLSFLHNTFIKHYFPQKTKADGNCLFSMISITLIGDESLSFILRCLTVFSMLLLQSETIDLIKNYYQIKDDNTAFRKYISLLYDAKKDKTWCSEFHLKIISTFLSKEIIIYSSFKNSNGIFFHPNEISSEELSLAFRNMNKTNGHHRIKAIDNSHFKNDKINEYLFGFFHINHYTAIIPRSEKEILFLPIQILI